ncbi:hypothetical protein S245_019310, partial [Arachis hypogaea]
MRVPIFIFAHHFTRKQTDLRQGCLIGGVLLKSSTSTQLCYPHRCDILYSPFLSSWSHLFRLSPLRVRVCFSSGLHSL